jgi:hypothetical protein
MCNITVERKKKLNFFWQKESITKFFCCQKSMFVLRAVKNLVNASSRLTVSPVYNGPNPSLSEVISETPSVHPPTDDSQSGNNGLSTPFPTLSDLHALCEMKKARTLSVNSQFCDEPTPSRVLATIARQLNDLLRAFLDAFPVTYTRSARPEPLFNAFGQVLRAMNELCTKLHRELLHWENFVLFIQEISDAIVKDKPYDHEYLRKYLRDNSKSDLASGDFLSLRQTLQLLFQELEKIDGHAAAHCVLAHIRASVNALANENHSDDMECSKLAELLAKERKASPTRQLMSLCQVLDATEFENRMKQTHELERASAETAQFREASNAFRVMIQATLHLFVQQ